MIFDRTPRHGVSFGTRYASVSATDGQKLEYELQASSRQRLDSEKGEGTLLSSDINSVSDSLGDIEEK
jgi:hypothetical protein